MKCQVTTLKVSEQSELVLAIYEVGQSFYQGWGVPKDKKMGVVRLSALQNFLYLQISELLPSGG